MKILITNVGDILNEKLTLQQRGILITLLIVKDDNSKITLAKFKVMVKMSKIKEDLISLHDKEYICWSGYKTAKKSIEDKEQDPKVVEVIDFMNNLYGRRFDSSVPSTVSGLITQLKTHTVEDVKGVVANRWEAWKNCSKMKTNLNPTTIFRTSKFKKYIEDLKSTGIGSGIVSVDRLKIEHGSEITIDIASKLIQSEVYNIRRMTLNAKGERVGSGQVIKAYGKALVVLIKTENNKIIRGVSKEFTYLYQNKN